MNITITNNPYIPKYNYTQNRNINRNFKSNNLAKDTFEINNKNFSNNKFSFTGVTKFLPEINPNNFDEILTQWDRLKFAPYYEALDDKILPSNKQIRKINFSFLDKLNSTMQEKFTRVFCELTSFPNFEKVAQKMENEYIKQVQNATKNISSEVKIITAGYDPTCSVGMRKPFPGSDLDKAFVVLKNNSTKNSYDVINEFKSELWFNTDQRILSLNNEDTFPEVYTLDIIKNTLKNLDEIVEHLNFKEATKEKFYSLRENELDPVKGGVFNIKIAEKLPYKNISKEYAKNFAYFIESVRDGKVLISDENLTKELEDCFKNSQFAQFSNVTQMGALKIKVATGEKDLKTKLKFRSELENNFEKMPISKRFELVKDIIKSISKDNDNPDFEKYFTNDDNIKERYDRLNRLLLS